MQAGHPPQPRQIQEAAPVARRRTVLFLAIATMTGLALLIGFEQWIEAVRQAATRNPKLASDQIAYVIRILAAVISLSLIGLALVVVRVSWQVYSARRFPPPGMSVIVDVPVIEGVRAVWRALAGFALGAVLGAMAVVMPYLLWRILSIVVPGPGA